MNVLTCNVGSTSLRLTAVEIAGDGRCEKLEEFHGAYEDLDAALEATGRAAPFAGVAHRIVHAGPYSLEKALALDAMVESAIEAARALAPDHNGAALHVVRRCRLRFGAQTPQIAVFDSHFHATIPERAYRYPLPAPVVERFGIRRYGFHGLSHAYSAEHVARMELQNGSKHVSVHAGGGVSVTAIERGRACDTSMGFTPLEGPMMATRSGSIDPGIIFEMHRKGMSLEQIERIVQHESGLLGLSGLSGDYGRLLAEARNGNGVCGDAVAMFDRSVAAEVARMAASLGGIDALSFTGGIGEHAEPFRASVCERLSFLGIGSRVPAFVIRAREDLMLARACAWALSASGRPRSSPV